MVRSWLSMAGSSPGQRGAATPIVVRAVVLGLAATMLVVVGLPAGSAGASSSNASSTARTAMYDAHGIFVDATRQGTLAQPTIPTLLRSRFVDVDFGRLRGGPEGPPAELTLNLFDDTTWTATVSHVEPAGSGSGFVWVGAIPTAGRSEVTLVVGDGILTGNVRADNAEYQIRFAGDGVHVVLQVDPSSFPAD